MEVLVAMVISMIAILTAAAIIAAVGKNVKSTETTYDTQNAIDQNISAIESAADRYVCGTSSCSVLSGGGIPTRLQYIDPSDTTAWNNFKNRCNQEDPSLEADLLYPLKDYIESTSSFGVPSGINRSITVHGNDAQDLTRIRHMTVQYRQGGANGKLLRDVTVMPTIVAYCP